MPWYELVALFFCLVSFLAFSIVGIVTEVKRLKAYKAMERKREKFYDIAGEWFYNHMSDKP